MYSNLVFIPHELLLIGVNYLTRTMYSNDLCAVGKFLNIHVKFVNLFLFFVNNFLLSLLMTFKL